LSANAADPEVFVIGGGPAGLAAAIAAAMAGLTVKLAEPVPGPIDKCCGEGLLPAAVLALGRLGIPAAALQAAGERLRGIRFRQGTRSATAKFSAAAFGVRRTALHALLHERAGRLGIEIVTAPARLDPAAQDRSAEPAVLVGGQILRPKWIIGADGGQSALRKASGLDERRVTSRRFSLRCHYQLTAGAEQSDCVEVFWARGAQAYVTPVGQHRVGVAVLAWEKLGSMESALGRFPDLKVRLAGAHACSSARGAVSFHQRFAHSVRGPIALIGDAGGSVDAITGDGLSLAFMSALALGSALKAGRLDQYEQAHRKLFHLPRVMSRTLLGMGAHPAVTTAAMALLGGVPALFSTLLHVHADVPRRLAHPVPEDRSWQVVPTSTRSAT
jgi:flavin-dependent dehydrogenase